MKVGIVVIGASWGGLHALKSLLGGLPAGFGAPIAVAQHRQPGGEELLAGLLRARTALNVYEAEDKDELVPGSMRLAPAGYHLLVDDRHLALSMDAAVRHSRPSIDVLFDSAARSYGPRAVGVVLTGANDDGAAGLAAVRRRGGTAIVQTPETAVQAAMPAAARAAAAPQIVAPLEEIAAVLASLDGAS
jgi:two-component system, chemotaxis family, protein-glutamate methylesterase/glutaminase